LDNAQTKLDGANSECDEILNQAKKDGEKLMGVTSQQKTSCDLEEYRTLQARIEKIREQLEEDDDEGGLVVRK